LFTLEWTHPAGHELSSLGHRLLWNTHYARVFHNRQWSNYNIVDHADGTRATVPTRQIDHRAVYKARRRYPATLSANYSVNPLAIVVVPNIQSENKNNVK